MYDGLLTKYDDCTKELAQWNDEESLKNKFVNALQERVRCQFTENIA